MPRCPSCNVPMTRVEGDTLRACTCSNCFGTWVNTTALKRHVNLESRNLAPASEGDASLPDLAAVVSESNTKKELRCPECAKPMAKTRFHHMIPISIDVCRRCSKMWLDAGELNLLRQLYREMANSQDPRIIQLREKIASVNLDLANRRSDIQRTISNPSDYSDGVHLLSGIIRALARV